jgi:putative hemolysin
MLFYEPQRHIHLAPSIWHPEQIQTWLNNWAVEALSFWLKDQNWQLHPRDASDFDENTQALYSIYCGQAGVWLALSRLAEAGYCTLPKSLSETFEAIYTDYSAHPDTGECVPSWFLGQTSLLTAICLLNPDSSHCETLAAMIQANRQNPTREALWGAPGTMLGALFMWEKTADMRWKTLFLDNVSALWESWFYDAEAGLWLWEQDMYGTQSRYIGAGHGWVGNLYPLWRGVALLSAEQQTQLHARTVAGLQNLARTESGLTNWPALAKYPENLPEKPLLQWCHGAPGIITALRHADLPECLPLLIGGGHLIVKAGPLSKGVGICHGTDGNGAALMALYSKTADPYWLAQARQFGLWALEQAETERLKYGQGRYSLWTGEAGLVCFLLDCLSGQSSGLPGLDWLI